MSRQLRGVSGSRLGMSILLLSALVLAGCSTEPSDDPMTDPEGTMTASDNRQGSEAAGIDVAGGFTQSEQIEELDAVVMVMQQHFGQDVAQADEEPWDAQVFESEVRPRSCNAEEYRYRVDFEIPQDADPQELFSEAADIAAELGLEPNENNGDGSGEGEEMFFGAGSSQGRMFVITTQGSSPSGFYQTRCSDDQTIQDVRERFAEQFREERRKQDAPPSDLPGQ